VKINFFILLTMLLFLNIRDVFSQTKKLDSLLFVLKNSKPDTAKVNTLIALGIEFRYFNTDTALYFAATALALATRLNYEMGIADSKRMIGTLYAEQGRCDEGVKTCNDALALYNKLLLSARAREKEEILRKIGFTYNEIGNNRFTQGNYPEALGIFFYALKIKEQTGDRQGISAIEFNIGNVYYCQHNYSEALKHDFVSLKIMEQLGNKANISSCYDAIGIPYFDQGNYPEALKNYAVSLKLAEESKDKYVTAEIYTNLGVVYDKQENYSKALKYDFAALKIYEEIKFNWQIPFVCNNVASVYIKQKKHNDASEYLNRALSIAKKTGHLEYTKLSYQNLEVLDSIQGNYKKALEDYKLVITYRDSLINKENTTKMVQLQMQYDFDKKESLAKAEQDKKDVLTVAEIRKQKITRNFSFAGIATILLFSGFGFYRYRRKKRIQNLQAMLNERLRISRELHDEVGATLSGIAMYSHLTKEQIRNNQMAQVEKSLNIMQQSSGEMVNKLNDIVWLINPEQDSLQKLIERLEEYARDMAAIKNMRVKIAVPVKIAELSLPVKCRRNIYLFCKEAINNAVKYSHGSLLELTVKEVDNKLEFFVSDNGKGFDAVMVRRGNGLANMQRRADEIGAKLLLQSKLNEGVLISLQYKIT
jgi:two-component system sensor histidine kinase UhpB